MVFSGKGSTNSHTKSKQVIMKGDFAVSGENMWEQVRKLWIKSTIICFKPEKKGRGVNNKSGNSWKWSLLLTQFILL